VKNKQRMPGAYTD